MTQPQGIAFYDFDGTLASCNVVTQYAFVARHHPSRPRAALKFARLLLAVPFWIGLDLYSRRRFNEMFFREYRGLSRAWLSEVADELFQRVIRPSIFPGARALVEADRASGFRTVLVTGTLDLALKPVVRHFGFDDVICNSLIFEDGAATGEVAAPLIAEREKVEAMHRLSRSRGLDLARSKAYSDSISDLPMLEAVGHPAAVNPERRLRRVALERAWPILDLKQRQAGPEPIAPSRCRTS
ncbi:MAG: HAD-IB family hydrolase [Bryobacteraceae bacterium]